MHEQIERTISEMEGLVEEVNERIVHAISPYKFLDLAEDLDRIVNTEGERYLLIPYKYREQLKTTFGGPEARAFALGRVNRLKDLNIVLQEQGKVFVELIAVPREADKRRELISEVNAYLELIDAYAKDLVAQDELFIDRNREIHVGPDGPLPHQIRTSWLLLCHLTAARDIVKRVREIHVRLGEIEEPVPASVRLPKAKLFKCADFTVDANLCFVLMPFEEPFNGIYEAIIKPAIEGPKVGMTCKRADDIYGTRAVMEDVWEYVNKAAVIVAELTGRNPNVFYELGLSHAVGTETILITQDASEIPFDLKHLRCIVYENNARGHKKLARDLIQTILAVRKPISARS